MKYLVLIWDMIKRMFSALLAITVIATLLVGCQHWRNSGSTPPAVKSPDALRIGTLNVHYIILSQETGPWSVGDWERRKAPLDAAFKATNADIIATQESESFARDSDGRVNLTLDWLLAQNPAYAAAAIGDPSVFPSTQPIYYVRDRFELLDEGWFFFSETPDVIYSRTFNGSWPAYATWAQFRDRRSDKTFRLLNLHTDYSSASNRRQSIELVVKRAKPWVDAGETVMIAGDFNERHGGKTLTMLEEIGFAFVPTQGATYHFNRGLNLFGAIDHIGYVNGVAPVGSPTVLRNKFLGEWPTDHYPVIADFIYAE